MDQINPLAELTHKRRLSALGPGGLSRDRAGFEVRDVHPSHYGRICPIETPEGPNIGLIASLATFARINDFGFLETPYRKVENGRVTESHRLPDRRSRGAIHHRPGQLADRRQGPFHRPTASSAAAGATSSTSSPTQVDYMDVSPKQLVSVAASLIPFLEHDDANRALMGSNMQRQAVPLLVTEAPLVATGLEDRVARDSRAVVVAEEAGKVASVTGRPDHHHRGRQAARGQEEDQARSRATASAFIEIRKFMRSNAATCINQKISRPQGRPREEGPGHRRRSVHRSAANWRSAATCSSRSCPGTVTTSRTPSSSARRS